MGLIWLGLSWFSATLHLHCLWRLQVPPYEFQTSVQLPKWDGVGLANLTLMCWWTTLSSDNMSSSQHSLPLRSSTSWWASFSRSFKDLYLSSFNNWSSSGWKSLHCRCFTITVNSKKNLLLTFSNCSKPRSVIGNCRCHTVLTLSVVIN